MRLTVRTLLAWRDHMLSEADQRDLNEKVLSHVAAQEIEQRIESVLGNLDMPSPQVDATGLAASANSMAEFLDNALPEDCLGPFESNCIESDVQLCEAAECHHILSEMLGQQGLIEVLPLNECQMLVGLTEAKASLLLSQEGQVTDVYNARSIREELDAIDAKPHAEISQCVMESREKKQRIAPFAIIVAVTLLFLLVSVFGFQLFNTFGNNAVQQQALQQPLLSDLSMQGIDQGSKDVAEARQAIDANERAKELSGEEAVQPAVEPLVSSDSVVKPQASEDAATQGSIQEVPIQKESASPAVGRS